MPIIDGYDFAYAPTVIFRAEEPWQFGREPVLRRMPDGSLCCLIYSGGPTEPHNENVVLLTRSEDDGTTWTAPVVLFDHPHRGVWATELFTAGPRPCVFVQTLNADTHYMELHAFRAFTEDHGRTWSTPASLPGGVTRVIPRQGIVLRDGSWVIPVYWQESPAGWGWGDARAQWGTRTFVSGVLRSEDAGQTFTLHGNLRAPSLLWEPNVIEVAPNRLVMLIRSDGTGVKFRADSCDGGRTWDGPVPTAIPDAGSKITLLAWHDAVLLLHNPSAQAGWDQRHTLALWISRDGCATWTPVCDLVRAGQPDSNHVVCYPHGFVDGETLYVAVDTVRAHYLLKVPLDGIV
jgi:predicted neuraminidase